MSGIGILGGTFDPIHKGHLCLAENALKEVGLEEVIFIPSAYPPHKNIEKLCNFEHRLKMLEIAIHGKKTFNISDIEAKRITPSYTFDTLRELKKGFIDGQKCFFIIGCDAFGEIESWHKWEDVISDTDFIIAVRPGYGDFKIEKYLEYLGFVDLDRMNGRWIKEDHKNEVFLLQHDIEDISSTEVREKIVNDGDWTDLIPEGVAEYINKHSLYI